MPRSWWKEYFNGSEVLLSDLSFLLSSFQFSLSLWDLPLLQFVQTGSEAYQDSYLVGTAQFFPWWGGTAAEAWCWPRLPSRAEVRNEWSCVSAPPVRIRGLYRVVFTFLTPSYLHYWNLSPCLRLFVYSFLAFQSLLRPASSFLPIFLLPFLFIPSFLSFHLFILSALSFFFSF